MIEEVKSLREAEIADLKEALTACFGADPMYYGVDADQIANGLYEEGCRKQRAGEWIVVDADSGSFGEYEPFINFKCPKCGAVHDLESGEYDWQYGDPIPWGSCPCCGAKMKGGAE